MMFMEQFGTMFFIHSSEMSRSQKRCPENRKGGE
jgi:hypothetical protein